MSQTKSDFTESQISKAAVVLRDAVVEELQAHPSGKSRRTIGSWRSVVAAALGRKRLLSRYYKLVVDEAVEAEILSIETRSGRDYLIPVDTSGALEEPIAERDDDAGAPLLDESSRGPAGGRNPDPSKYRHCAVCGSLSSSDDDCDLYFDSSRVLCCNGCNDLIPPDLRDRPATSEE
tara:strand:+ start:175 stop:705 length:531 start_codon:yes stop_codon:yes gene_type:complete